MFERLVSKALGDFLSKYFTEESLAKNGASNSAQLGVWSGYITLSNIQLKKEVINEKLKNKGQPFEIVQCTIRKVEITIPWAQMSNPIQSTDRSRDEGVVVVVLDGISLLVKTKFDFDDVALRVGDVEKRRKELKKSTYPFNDESNSSKSSFTDSVKQRITSGLLQQIMDKFHVHIRDLHIRIEDVESDPANPYAFGVSLESMHLHHDEDNGTDGDIVKKVMQLNRFAAYWTVCDYAPDLPEENSLLHQVYDDAEVVSQKLNATISRRGSLIASPSRHVHAPKHTYVLLPVDGMMYLDLSTSPNDLTQRPALSATIVIDSVSTQLRDYHCVQMLRLYREVKNHQFVKKYRRFRPLVSVKEDSRAWWQYAARVIRYQLKENFMRWSRTRFAEGHKSRQRYMMLYEKKVSSPNEKLEEKASILSLNNHPIALLKAQKSFESSIEEGNDSTTLTSDLKPSVPLQLQEQGPVTLEELVELQALEDGKIGDLSVSDIILFRAIVNMRGGRPINTSQNSGNDTANEGSWWKNSLAKVANDSDTRIEFNRLLKLLNGDQKKTAAPLLRNRLQTAVEVSLRLQEVSASIFTPSHLTKDERPLRRLHNKFLEFKSLSVRTKTGLKGDYKTIDYQLSVMDVLGLEVGADIGEFVISSQATRVDPGDCNVDPEQSTLDSPFLQFAVTKHPKAPSACDLEVVLSMNSMEVYLTPDSKWIRNLQGIAKQLSGLPKVADFWKDLSLAYVNSLALGNLGLRAKAEYGVEDHKSIDVDISIECPKIRISDGDGWDMIIDLGSAVLKTAKLAGVSRSNLQNSSVVIENHGGDNMMAMMRTMNGMDDGSAIGSEIGPSPIKYRFEVGTPNLKRGTSISSAISVGSKARSRTGGVSYDDALSFRYDGGDNSVGGKSRARDAGMQMNEIFYDVYVFRLQTGKITTKGVESHELSPGFGISTTIKKSILPSDHTICKLKASTLIDNLTLNLNESSIMHFAKLLRIWKGITRVHSSSPASNSLNPFPSRIGVLDDQIGNQMSQSRIEADILDDAASLSQVDEGEFFDANDGYDSMSNSSVRWFDDNWIADTESVIDADSRSLRGGRSRRKRSNSMSEASSNSGSSFVGRKNVSGIYLSAENLANLNEGISEADESFGEIEGSDCDSFHSVMSAGGQMNVLSELEDSIARIQKILNQSQEMTANGKNSDLNNHSAHSTRQGMGAASKVEILRATAELNILRALHADLSSMLDGVPSQEISSNEKSSTLEDRSHLPRSVDHHARAARAILDATHRRESITRASNTHNLTRNLNRELFQGSILVGKIQVTLQLEQEAAGGARLGSNDSILKLVAEDTAVAVSKRRVDTKLYFSMDQMEVSSGNKDEETSFLLLSCGSPDTQLPSHFPHLVSRSMEEKFIRGAFQVTQHHKDSSSDRNAKRKKLRLVLGDIEAAPCEQHILPALSCFSRIKKSEGNLSKNERAVPDHADQGTHGESKGKSVVSTTGSISDIAVRFSSIRMILRQNKRVVSALAVSELSARFVQMESHLKNKLQLDLQCTNVQILEIESLESGFGGELFGRRDAYTSLIQMRIRSELTPSHETGGWVLGMGKPKLRYESLSLEDNVRNVHIGVRVNPINIASSPSGVRGLVQSIGELKDATTKTDADKSSTKPVPETKRTDRKIPLRFRCDISLRRIAIAFHEAERDWWNVTTDGGSNVVAAFTVIASLQGSTLGRKSLSSQVALADVTVIRSIDEWPVVEPFTVVTDVSLTASSATSETPEMEKNQLQIPNDSRLNEVKPFLDLFVWEKLPSEHPSDGEIRVSIKITPINVNVSAPVICLLANTKEKLQQVVSATMTEKIKVKKTDSTASTKPGSLATCSQLVFISVEAIECIVLKEAESRPISSAKSLFSLQQKGLQIEFSSKASTAASLSIREFSLIDFASVHGIRVLGKDPTGRESNGSQNPIFFNVELFANKRSDGPNTATLTIHWGPIQCLPVPSFVASLLSVSQDVKSTLQSRAKMGPAAKPESSKGNALSKFLGNPRDTKLTLKADAESFECILPSTDLVEYVKAARTDPIGVVSLRWQASLSMAAALDSLTEGSEPWVNLDLDGSLSDKKDNGLFKDFSDRYFSQSSGILDKSDEKVRKLDAAFTACMGLVVKDFQILRTEIACTTLTVSSNGPKGASRLSKNRVAFKVCSPQAGEQRITNPIDLQLSYRAAGASMSGPSGGDERSPSVEISQLLELEATKAVDFLLYISQGERGWTEAQKVTIRPILDLLKKKQARRKKDDTSDTVHKKEAQPNSIKVLAMSATTLCSMRLPGFQVTFVPGGATNLNESPIIKFELSSLSVGLAFLPVHKNVGLAAQKSAASYGGQLVPEGKVDVMDLIAAGWIDCVMSAHYHNRRLVAWEPFVEPWTANIRFGANLAEVVKVPPILKRSFDESHGSDFDPWRVSKLNEGTAGRLRDVGRLFRAPFHSAASKSSDHISHTDLCYLMLASTARSSILAAQYPTKESSDDREARVFLLLPRQDAMGFLRGFGFPDTSRKGSREAPEHYSVSCIISDQKPLNVNLTGALIENVIGYMDNSKKSGFESIAPHWIRNESGLTIRFQEVLESDRIKLGEEAGRTVLSDGSQIPLTLKRSVSQSCDPHRAYIHLELASPADFDGRIDNGDIDDSTGDHLDSFLYKTAAKIPVDTVGVHRYPLDKNLEMLTETGVMVTDTRSLGWIIVRVALHGGTKVISVESPFIIRSSADTDLLCELRDKVSQSVLWRYLIPKVDDQRDNDEYSGFVSIPADIVPLVHDRAYSFKVIAFAGAQCDEIDLSSIPDSAIRISVPPPFSDLSVRKGLLQEREVVLPAVAADSALELDPEASPDNIRLSVCSIRIGNLSGVASGTKIPEQRMLLFRSPLVIRNFLALPVALQIRVKYHDISTNDRSSDRSPGASREQALIRKETMYMEWQDIGVLDCGQSTNWTGALSTDRVQIRVRFVGLDGDNSRRFPGWSSSVTIPTKDNDNPRFKKNKGAFDHLRVWDADEIPVDLSVALETGTHATDSEMDNIRHFAEGVSSGTRVVSLFVPYWVVDSTNEDLEFSAGAPIAGQLDKHVSVDASGSKDADNGMLGLAELMDNTGFMNLPSKSPFDVMMIGDSSATRLTIRKRVSRLSRRRLWRHPSPWSDPIPLRSGRNSQHDTTVLSFIDQSKVDSEEQGQFDRFVLRSSMKPAPDTFGGGLGTMLIHIVNRYAIINEIGRDFEILQGHEDGVSLLVRASSNPQPFHFDVSKSIQFRFKEFGWDWSGKFHIRMNRREVTMRLRHKMKGERVIVTVEVQAEKNSATCLLVFRQATNPPFRLENQTMHPLYFGQSATARSSKEADADTMLLPYQSADFAWDEPELRRRAMLIKYRDPRNGRDSVLGRFFLDRSVPGSKPTVENSSFAMVVVADGPTRVLRLTDAAMPHMQQLSNERTGEKNDFRQLQDKDNAFTVSLVVRLSHGLGVSVVDWSPQELVYARLDDIQVERNIDMEKDTVTLAVGNIKMNNQLWVTPYPVLLKMGRRSDSNGSLRRNRKNDAISVSWRRPLTPTGGYGNVTILELVELSSQPLFANVDGNLVHFLLRMIKQVSGTTDGTTAPTTLSRDDELKKILSVHRDNGLSNVAAPKKRTIASFNQDADGELITTAAIAAKLKAEPLPLVRIQPRVMARKKQKRQQFSSKTKRKYYIEKIKISAARADLSWSGPLPGRLSNLLLRALTFERLPLRLRPYSGSHAYGNSEDHVQALKSYYVSFWRILDLLMGLSYNPTFLSKAVVYTLRESLASSLEMLSESYSYNAKSLSRLLPDQKSPPRYEDGQRIEIVSQESARLTKTLVSPVVQSVAFSLRCASAVTSWVSSLLKYGPQDSKRLASRGMSRSRTPRVFARVDGKDLLVEYIEGGNSGRSLLSRVRMGVHFGEGYIIHTEEARLLQENRLSNVLDPNPLIFMVTSERAFLLNGTLDQAFCTVEWETTFLNLIDVELTTKERISLREMIIWYLSDTDIRTVEDEDNAATRNTSLPCIGMSALQSKRVFLPVAIAEQVVQKLRKAVTGISK